MSMKAKISRKIMFMAMSKSIDPLSCDSRLYERRNIFLQRKYHNILFLSLFYDSGKSVGRKDFGEFLVVETDLRNNSRGVKDSL